MNTSNTIEKRIELFREKFGEVFTHDGNLTEFAECTSEFEQFLEESMEQVEAETKKQTAEEILNSMIEEYDLSDKESPNGWMDVIPCELRAFIYELKSKYGIQETEKE